MTSPRLLRTVTLATLAAAALGAARAAAEDAPAGYEVPLFDGESLRGWVVTGCEAVVDEGTLLLKDGDGFVRTEHRYGDFVLELEWKALRDEKWDSGIYLRSELPEGDAPWPARYQVNLLQGKEGNLIGFPEAVSEGLVKPGEWNHFRLTVIGSTAELAINGQPAWKVDGIEAPSGYVGLQCEAPGGGQFRFRNLKLTELGYRSLLDGPELTAWEGAGAPADECWRIEEGVLVCEPKRGPWLRSKEEFGDFNLRLDYRVAPGGNSGVYLRVPEGGEHHGRDAGLEVQILDDHAEKHASLQPYQYCGSLYGLVPAEPRVSRPAEEWNSLEIDCRGGDYRVTHNGVVVAEGRSADHPGLAERRLAGFLGLQHHGGGVSFRRLRIGPPLPSPGG